MPKMNMNGTSIYYSVQGVGVPIIFVHPPLLNSANFHAQRRLADEFQLIFFDIRGHGYSEASKTPLTYPLIVGDMIQLLDQLQIDKCYICGYSTGGSIALEAQLTYPERFFGGILLSAMSEVNDWWLRLRIRAASLLSSLNMKKLLVFAITTGNADQVRTLRRLYREAKIGDIRNMKQYYRYSNQYNCTEKLHTIKTPQLLIYGQRDKSFHRYAHLLNRHLPQNELVFMDHESHQLPTKAAKEMNLLIRHWIRKQKPFIDQWNQQTMEKDSIVAENVTAIQEHEQPYHFH